MRNHKAAEQRQAIKHFIVRYGRHMTDSQKTALIRDKKITLCLPTSNSGPQMFEVQAQDDKVFMRSMTRERITNGD